MALTVGSIFSGVGGFDMGFDAAGFEAAWQIEIDRDCISVLERHWPNVPRYGDVRSVDPSSLAPVDVVVFGSPCQDFSVAGKRAGMAGERSGLFGEATRIIAGLRPKPAVCVWENVPGALSSAGGRDFGAALDALADLGALDIAWRVLDARHWGVPQRRRRVFVVGDLGGERAASILFEPEGGSGHPAPSGAAGEGAAGDAEGGAGVAGALRTGSYGHGTGSERGDGSDALIVAAPLTAGSHPNSNMPGRHREDDENPVAIPISSDAAGGRTGDAETPSADAEGNIRPRPPSLGVGDPDDPSFAVNATGAPAVAVAFNWQAGGGGNDTSFRGKSRQYIERAGDYAGALSTTRHDAVAISENRRAEVRETPHARRVTAGGGKAGQGYPAVREGMAVRRLTPRECEMLMGWPAGHTERRADGSEISDGPRYRMIGNGVVAPVAAWIAGRIAEVL